MKYFILLFFCLCLTGNAYSYEDFYIGNTIPENTIHDNKYGDISSKSYLYLNQTSVSNDRAVIDVNYEFDRYHKTKEFDDMLKQEGKIFFQKRNEMLNQINQGQNTLSPDQLDKLKKDVVLYDRIQRDKIANQRSVEEADIMSDIKKQVAAYALEYNIKAVYSIRTPGVHEKNISHQILKLLNK